jgi:hypothetical protein
MNTNGTALRPQLPPVAPESRPAVDNLPEDMPSSLYRAGEELDESTRNFYLRALQTLDDAGIDYMVGGAYSLGYHAGIVRHTKDLDTFVRPIDSHRALDALGAAGLRAEMIFPHWLGKALDPKDETTFVDVIFGSGNGLCPVDDEMFANAVSGEALGRSAKLCPAEEIIFSKAFVQERERFDGADIHHLVLARGHELDWERLLRRFTGFERVLLAHLLNYGFAFPADRAQVPDTVLEEVWRRIRAEPAPEAAFCRGPFISRQQYLVDLAERG